MKFFDFRSSQLSQFWPQSSFPFGRHSRQPQPRSSVRSQDCATSSTRASSRCQSPVASQSFTGRAGPRPPKTFSSPRGRDRSHASNTENSSEISSSTGSAFASGSGLGVEVAAPARGRRGKLRIAELKACKAWAWAWEACDVRGSV